MNIYCAVTADSESMKHVLKCLVPIYCLWGIEIFIICNVSDFKI